jgi:hypothetical protein
MDSCDDTPKGGLPHSDIHGSTPARGSPWLFAACHVLHRLLVPRHPPNALLILDTHPQAATQEPQSSHAGRTHHAQTPSSKPENRPAHASFTHHQTLPGQPAADHSRNRPAASSNTIRHAPLNPRRRPLGQRSREHHTRSDTRPNSGTLSQPGSADHQTKLGRTRPETHQNLIHPDKEPHARQRRPRFAMSKGPDQQVQGFPHAKRQHSAIRDTVRAGTACRHHVAPPVMAPPVVAPPVRRAPQSGRAPTPDTSSLVTTAPWQPLWRRSGSNRRPPACKAGALPAELRPPKPWPETHAAKPMPPNLCGQIHAPTDPARQGRITSADWTS